LTPAVEFNDLSNLMKLRLAASIYVKA